MKTIIKKHFTMEVHQLLITSIRGKRNMHSYRLRQCIKSGLNADSDSTISPSISLMKQTEELWPQKLKWNKLKRLEFLSIFAAPQKPQPTWNQHGCCWSAASSFINSSDVIILWEFIHHFQKGSKKQRQKKKVENEIASDGGIFVDKWKLFVLPVSLVEIRAVKK